MINKEELLKFIAKAHQSTYAAPKEIRDRYQAKTPITPGHTEFNFADGSWSYFDSYAGLTRTPGREVIFFKNKPVWSMSYAGMLKPNFTKDAAQIYGFLKTALMNFEDSKPFRGPARWQEGNFLYTFSFDGDVNFFSGRESILQNGIEVYFQNVIASIIE